MSKGMLFLITAVGATHAAVFLGPPPETLKDGPDTYLEELDKKLSKANEQFRRFMQKTFMSEEHEPAEQREPLPAKIEKAQEPSAPQSVKIVIENGSTTLVCASSQECGDMLRHMESKPTTMPAASSSNCDVATPRKAKVVKTESLLSTSDPHEAEHDMDASDGIREIK